MYQSVRHTILVIIALIVLALDQVAAWRQKGVAACFSRHGDMDGERYIFHDEFLLVDDLHVQQVTKILKLKWCGGQLKGLLDITHPAKGGLEHFTKHGPWRPIALRWQYTMCTCTSTASSSRCQLVA